jgi:oxygen-dependent protoporphyrinogen oxidase
VSGHLVIIGGGVTGLSAAWYAIAAGLRVTVLEAGAAWGGKVRTERVENEHGTFILETGADAFLTRKPWALGLARELGLDDHIIGVNRANSRTLVFHHGSLHPLPDGLTLLVPTRIRPFLASPLFSAAGKLRVLLEPFIPPRRDGGDESLAQFVRRRLGAEMLDRLAEPLLAGVYNGDAERQSITATFPQFPQMEREHGSLLRGARRPHPLPPSPFDGEGEKNVRGVSPLHRVERGRGEAPPFISFRAGTQELIEALVRELPRRGADLRLNCGVRALSRRHAGGYTVALTDGETLQADAVILATPAATAADLLQTAAPDAAARLREFRTAGIGAATLAFRRSDVPHPLDALGVVIPSSAHRSIDGITFVTSKWEGRAPADTVVLRCFFGGPHTRPLLDADDETLIGVVRHDLRAMLKIEVPPLFAHVYRWRDGYPQYELGHLARVEAVEAALPPGVLVTGSPYRGVGVPDCVRQGKAAAERAAEVLKSTRSYQQE